MGGLEGEDGSASGLDGGMGSSLDRSSDSEMRS